MKRFDVFSVNDPHGVEAVVVVQGDFYLDLPSILVVPLYSDAVAKPIDRVNLSVDLNGKTLIFKTEEMTSAPAEALVRPIGNLEKGAFQIQIVMDRIFSGY